MFSIGGDGALHVLDDADATGYVKPVSISDGRRKVARNFPSATGRGTSGRDGNDVSKVESESDDKAGGKAGQEEGKRKRARRGVPVPNEKRPEKKGSVETCTADLGAPVVVDLGRGAEAEGEKKNRDEGWSVLLRQVAFASGDSDDEGPDSGQGKPDRNSQPQSQGALETTSVSAPDDHDSAVGDPSDSSAMVGSSSKPRLVRLLDQVLPV